MKQKRLQKYFVQWIDLFEESKKKNSKENLLKKFKLERILYLRTMKEVIENFRQNVK